MNKTIASWPKWTAYRLGLLKQAIKPPAALALGLISSLLLASAATAANSVQRTLPDSYQPNQEITVKLSITTEKGGWALTEIVPEGWTVTDGAGGTVQTNGREIRFFEMAQANNKTISYKAKPSASTTTNGTFSGSISVAGTSYDSTGDKSIAPAGGEVPDPDPTDPDPTDPDPTDPDPTDPDPSGNSVVRTLPDTYTAGKELSVTLLVTTAKGGWALTEIAPEGWTVTDGAGGTVQTNGREIRFFDIAQATNKTITYKAKPSTSATAGTFSGSISVAGTSYDSIGDKTISPAGGVNPDPDPVVPVEPFTVTRADGTTNLPAIYNLSGTYNYSVTLPDEGGEVSLNYTLVHNQHGRLSGGGNVTLTEGDVIHEDDNIQVSGTVRRLGNPAAPVYRVNIVVKANSLDETTTASLNQNLEIIGSQLVGNAKLHVTDADGHEDTEISGIAIDLPEGRDGSWTLGFTPGTTESPAGTAVFTVPGEVLTYNLGHKVLADQNLKVFTLEGTEGTAGNTIRIATDDDGNVVRMLGRALGQNLNMAPLE